MPSSEHEGLVELFRHRPELVVDLLHDVLAVELPRYQRVRLESADLTELTPTEYRADLVVTLADADGGIGAPVLAVVVEVQLSRDGGKRWSWPVYLATLRARLRCPVVLLVVCTDAAVAGWCATPVELGHPRFVLAPLVVGPRQVPVVTDAGVACAAPELAVLSAMAHAAHPDRDKVLRALVDGLASVDQERWTLYSDVVFAALPAAARRYLEALMGTGTYEYRSEFVRRYVLQGRAEGRVEGEARAVLAVLATRGIEVPDDVRARISGCTDVEQVETWLRRAVTARTVADLFD
ncbi:hypothetical protein WEI85_22125 [Actinomycetes bacterium KLBMP 9797]